MKHFRLLRWITEGLLALAALFAGYIIVQLGIAADEYGIAFAWNEWPPYAQWAAFLGPMVLLLVCYCLFAGLKGKALKKSWQRIVMVCCAVALAVAVGSFIVSGYACANLHHQKKVCEEYVNTTHLEWTTEHFRPISMEELEAMKEEKYTGIVYITTSGQEENVSFHEALQDWISETDTTMRLYDARVDELACGNKLNEVLKSYGVSSLPAILVLSEGVVAERFEGTDMLENVSQYLANS